MNERAAVAILLLACAVTALSLLKRTTVPARFAVPLRALFPSWRFFEVEDERFSLWARVAPDDGEHGAFVALPPACQRGVLSLVFAPHNNLRLSCHDLIERLAFEIAAGDGMTEAQLAALTSYQLVQNMAVYYLRKSHGSTGRYQLKLLSHESAGACEEVFVSPFYTLS